MPPRPPISTLTDTLFPYTSLFRSVTILLALPAFVGESHAAAKAFSSLHVEDFIASEGGTQFDQGDFDNLGITNSGQNSATLTGFAGEVFGDAGAADIDPDHACVGNSCA